MLIQSILKSSIERPQDLKSVKGGSCSDERSSPKFLSQSWESIVTQNMGMHNSITLHIDVLRMMTRFKSPLELHPLVHHTSNSLWIDCLLLREFSFYDLPYQLTVLPVYKRVDVFNSYFYDISWDEILCWLHGKAFYSWTPCPNHTACLKSGALAAEGDNLGNAEMEVQRVVALTDFLV